MFPTLYIPRNVILTPDTYIDFRVDGTSSMINSYPGIQDAVQNLLKAELLPYYNNDSAWYDDHVTIFQTDNVNAQERPLYELTRRNAALPGGDRLIVIWFCDEASPYGAGNGDTFDPAAARVSQYNTDMTTLRSFLATCQSTYGSNYYKGGFVEVETEFVGPYKLFLQTIRDGTGQYSGTNGLSDRAEFVYKLGYLDDQNGAYYLEVIRETLSAMGVSF